MHLDPRRLRSGEWLAGAGALVMFIALFALQWYGPASGAPHSRNGWEGTNLHWLALLAILAGLALVLAQAACRAPALPSSLSVVSTVIAFVTVIWLLFRVVIDPGPAQRLGAWLELIGALALLVGSFVSLRQEGIPEREAPTEIPVVDLPAAGDGASEAPA